MAFTTPFSAKFLKSALCCLALGLALSVQAETLRFRRAEMLFANDRVAVTAFSDITLPAPLDEALHRGLTLPFIYEFHLSDRSTRSAYRLLGNWVTPDATMNFHLSYQALTGAYRLTSGSLTRSFATQNDALMALGVVYDWIVEPLPEKHSRLAGMIRLRLDTDQLPKHYQLTAFGKRDWVFDSGWIDLVQVKSWGD
jgi:hypothetical protein